MDDNLALQVDLLRNRPLIPDHVTIHGYVYAVKAGRLRPPHRVLSRKVSSAHEMAAVM